MSKYGDEEDYIQRGRWALGTGEQIAKEKGTTLELEVRQWLNDLGAGRWKPSPGEPKKSARKRLRD